MLALASEAICKKKKKSKGVKRIIVCVRVCVLIPKGGFYIQYSFNNCTSIDVFGFPFFIFMIMHVSYPAKNV